MVFILHNGSFGDESLSSNKYGKVRMGGQRCRHLMRIFRFSVERGPVLFLNYEAILNSETA